MRVKPIKFHSFLLLALKVSQLISKTGFGFAHFFVTLHPEFFIFNTKIKKLIFTE